MKKISIILKGLYIILIAFQLFKPVAYAQICERKDTMLTIDFGNGKKASGDFILWTGKYRKVQSDCPNDGEYTIASRISDCFGGSWITHSEAGGNMLLVNAPESPMRFIHFPVFNLKAGEIYTFEFKVANILRKAVGCVPTQPDLTIIIETKGGRQISSFSTGSIPKTNFFLWRKYQGSFTFSGSEKDVYIRIENTVPGGCGNDFVLDDLMLIRCIPPKPVKPKTVPPVTKELRKPVPAVSVPTEVRLPTPVKIPEMVEPVRREEPPKPADLFREALSRRENSVIRKIKTSSKELTVEIYDNNLVDGDSVSIYHNEKLIRSNVAITHEPLRFTISLGPFTPHHEITLVAENLGTTPPNTAEMMIIANGKKTRIELKSNKERNATVVIDWEKD